MQTTTTETGPRAGARPLTDVERRKTPRKATFATYGIEALVGAGVVVLAIVALARVLPDWLTGIAAILAGAAFLIEGAGLGSRARHARRSLGAEGVDTAGLAGATSTQILAGATGVTLGILALTGVAPTILLAISAIVFGAALLLGSSAAPEVIRLEASHPYEASVARETIQASNGARILIGAGAATLGILSLLGVGPVFTLVVVAFLGVGVILFLSGLAIGAGEATAPHHA